MMKASTNPSSVHRSSGFNQGRAVPRHRPGYRAALERASPFQVAPEAGKHFGWITLFAGLDAPASGAKTGELLGWRPTQAGLLADMSQASYFET